MNETTTTTMSDWPEDVQEFAMVIIEIVKAKHKEYERQHEEYERQHEELDASPVPLEKIHFGIANFENFCNVMQGIAPYQDWKKTAQNMLGSLLWTYREIESFRGCYHLTKHGILYRHIKEELARTQ